MQLSVGEDLLATLTVVGLLGLFIAALAHSHQIHAERKKAREDFELALSTAEEIKNRVLAASPGSIRLEKERLESYSKQLAMCGIEVRVEVRNLNGDVLLTLGPDRSPPEAVSVSLPVAVYRGQGSGELCELIVRIRRE